MREALLLLTANPSHPSHPFAHRRSPERRCSGGRGGARGHRSAREARAHPTRPRTPRKARAPERAGALRAATARAAPPSASADGLPFTSVSQWAIGVWTSLKAWHSTFLPESKWSLVIGLHLRPAFER
eukprot:scaffold47288_cov25-Tisochrysis_lutea.AAC.3